MNLTSLSDLAELVLAGELGPDPSDRLVSVGFSTRQGARHASRDRSYRNQVISLRVGRAVGSCAVEPGDPADVEDCVGASVRELLFHPAAAVRVAALDAYLMDAHPHGPAPVTIPSGTSLEKSMARARAVTGLVPETAENVLVIGVVNSLLESLRDRGLRYLPCDLKGGTTERDEPVVTDAATVLDACDAVLASGMTLGNGSFDRLLAHARETGKPFVLFAQTGSAVLPWFIGSGVTAVSAEPYPFFWLDGGQSLIHLYRERPCSN